MVLSIRLGLDYNALEDNRFPINWPRALCSLLTRKGSPRCETRLPCALACLRVGLMRYFSPHLVVLDLYFFMGFDYHLNFYALTFFLLYLGYAQRDRSGGEV